MITFVTLICSADEERADAVRGVFMAVSVVAYTKSQKHNYVQKLLQLMASKLKIAPKLSVIMQNLKVLTSDRAA
jgi:hypothetical protein